MVKTFRELDAKGYLADDIFIGEFCKLFKTIRINEAKRLLGKTDKKIIEISSLMGYENVKHFMKIFKSVCGVSPSEYRKNAQVGKLDFIP